MKSMLPATLAAAALLSAGGTAFAAAPPPKKPVELERLMGRWHEIARVPNPRQKGCEAPTAEWAPGSAEQFSVTQTCRQGSPTGPLKVFKAKARVVDPKTQAKVKLSFFGGVISQEYWILDRADDYSWAVMGTPGGNYMWLLSRRPELPVQSRGDVMARVKALGFDPAKLEYPKQP